MREIKYRGKAMDDQDFLDEIGIEHENGWVYGWYANGFILGNVIEAEEDRINFEYWVAVIEQSVGQFTGLCDKNGTPIYEGDIVHVEDRLYGDVIRVVNYDEGNCKFGWREMGRVFSKVNSVDFTVLGNVYQNPELIKEQD